MSSKSSRKQPSPDASSQPGAEPSRRGRPNPHPEHGAGKHGSKAFRPRNVKHQGR